MSNTPQKNPTPSPKILALCDSMVARPGNALTGFGRVVYNLFIRWRVPIDVWTIGFEGYNYKTLADEHPYITLLPGGNADWNQPARLGAFLKQLRQGNYTHVFILMDPDAISGTSFPSELRKLCQVKNVRSLLYYPVDAPLLKPYDIISAMDVVIPFTEYGVAETKRVLPYRNIAEIIPHGIDAHFTPVTREEREYGRSQFMVGETGRKKPFLKPGDILLLNVNKNEWRKDPLRSLEILKGLRDRGVPAKLVLRMAPASAVGGINLERAGEQLGLTLDKEWAHIPPVAETHMRFLYGAADLYLTTSLGEGWGFGVTEALACGTPVVLPTHTSLAEIYRTIRPYQEPGMLVPLEDGHVCGYDPRLRRRVELNGAVEKISAYINGFKGRDLPRIELAPEIREWLSWDRIANEFLKLMRIEPPAQCQSKNLRVEFIFSIPETTNTQPTETMNIAKLTTGQQVVLSALFETAKGAPASIVGTPTWNSDNAAVATVTPAPDGLSATIESVGPGTANITVSGEGDATPGVDTVTGQAQINVVNPEASQVVLTFGTPTDIPAAS